jgi:hypothetical protein
MEKNDERKIDEGVQQIWSESDVPMEKTHYQETYYEDDDEIKKLKDLSQKHSLSKEEKDALKCLFKLIEDAEKQKKSSFLLGNIETSGRDANEAVKSFNYQDVDPQMPYDIFETPSGMGVFTNFPAMKKVIKKSIAWIREILKHSPHKLKDNKSKILKDDKFITGEQRALCLLLNHPNWTDKKIAKEVGVNRTSLYRWGSYKNARMRIKEEGKKGLLKGYKTQDGDIEAYK